MSFRLAGGNIKRGKFFVVFSAHFRSTSEMSFSLPVFGLYFFFFPSLDSPKSPSPVLGISPAEAEYIKMNTSAEEEEEKADLRRLSWMEMLQYRQIWAAMFSGFCCKRTEELQMGERGFRAHVEQKYRRQKKTSRKGGF